MTTSVLDDPAVSIRLDPRRARWTVDVDGHSFEVREWTWGERWRLVDDNIDDGRLDSEKFIVDLVDLLVDPVPSDELRSVAASIVLRLQGVDPDGERPRSLLELEADLISRWGWQPSDVDDQPARRLDQHLATSAIETGSVPDDGTAGWNSIVVSDG